MVLGNHEFDHGPKYIHPFIKKAKFPVLTANVDFTQQPGWPTAPKFHLKSTILKVANVSIGVIGYITPETEWNSSPGPHVKFTPILSAVSREVRYYVYHFFISTISFQVPQLSVFKCYESENDISDESESLQDF